VGPITSSDTVHVDYLSSDSLKLDAIECSNEPLGPAYEDGNVKIYAIPSTSDVGSSMHTDGNEAQSVSPLKRKHSYSEEEESQRKRSGSEGNVSDPDRRRSRLQWRHGVDDWRQMIVSRMFPGTDGIQFRAEHEITFKDLKKRLPTWRGRRTATSYLLEGPEYRGKFDAALADKLQVSKRDRAKLARGESVNNMIGDVITPEMVLGPSSPAAVCVHVITLTAN
jgi:ribonuclease Z